LIHNERGREARALFLNNTADEGVEALDIISDSLPIPPLAQGHRESVAQLTARSFAAAHMML
jgi:hypothetical protein